MIYFLLVHAWSPQCTHSSRGVGPRTEYIFNSFSSPFLPSPLLLHLLIVFLFEKDLSPFFLLSTFSFVKKEQTIKSSFLPACCHRTQCSLGLVCLCIPRTHSGIYASDKDKSLKDECAQDLVSLHQRFCTSPTTTFWSQDRGRGAKAQFNRFSQMLGTSGDWMFVF